MTGTVLLLPWIQIEKPITIGDVTFCTFGDALLIAGEARGQLEAVGSIYVEGYTLGIAAGRGEPVPHIYPTVVFVAENDKDGRHARDAVDVLMLSTILENSIMHANGATFAHVMRWLGGERGFMVDITPRMHGSTRNLIGAEAYLEMKPPHVGPFHHARRLSMVDALWAAVNSPTGDDWHEVFDTLRTATSESPDVSMDLARSLMAKAATLLTHQLGMPDKKGPLLARLRALLGRLIAESTGDAYGFHIARVWQAVRDHRNEFWHPEPWATDTFPFMGQRLVAPMLLALRMVHAVLAARLIEDGFAPEDGELADDVNAIEQWIATLAADLEKGLEPVRCPVTFMARKKRVDDTHDAFYKLRSRARLARGVARAMRTSSA